MAGSAGFPREGRAALFEAALGAAAALGRVPLERSLAAGEHLVRQAEEALGVWFIRSGLLRTSLLEENGRELLLALSGPGETIGEVEYFLGCPLVCEVRACEPSRCAFFPSALLDACLARDPEVAKGLGRVLAARLKRNSLRVAESLAYPLPYLVLKTLSGRMGGESPSAFLRIGELAGYVGASARQMSRILAALEAEGLVRREGRSVAIGDLGKALARLASYEAGGG